MSMSNGVKTIEDCYISIEVEESQLKELYDSFSRILNRLEIPHEISPRPHVSIAYTLGTTKKDFFEKLLIELAKKKEFCFKPAGISIISGEFIEKDFIALRLDKNEDFCFATNFIAEKCPIKLFKDGFIAHVSLFQVPKLKISKDNHFLISKYLENAFSDLTIKTSIKACSISAFNKSRQIELEFKIIP
jgi:hypothetical protein